MDLVCQCVVLKIRHYSTLSAILKDGSFININTANTIANSKSTAAISSFTGIHRELKN